MLTDREKEQLEAMIDAGEPLPPRYRAVLFAQPNSAELIWPGKKGRHKIAVKVIDIFGNDTTKVVEVTA